MSEQEITCEERARMLEKQKKGEAAKQELDEETIFKRAFSRRLTQINTNKEDIKQLERHVNKNINALQKTLAEYMSKQQEYLIDLEKRLESISKEVENVKQMPTIDGDRLLSKVEEIHKQVVRIDKNTMKFKREDEQTEEGNGHVNLPLDNELPESAE